MNPLRKIIKSIHTITTTKEMNLLMYSLSDAGGVSLAKRRDATCGMLIFIISKLYFENEIECKSGDPYIKAQAFAEKLEALIIDHENFKNDKKSKVHN